MTISCKNTDSKEKKTEQTEEVTQEKGKEAEPFLVL